MSFLDSTGLQSVVTKIKTLLAGKVDIAQGAANRGKPLVVGNTGNVAVGSFPAAMAKPGREQGYAEVYSDETGTGPYTFRLNTGKSITDGSLLGGEVWIYTEDALYRSDLSLCVTESDPDTGDWLAMFHNTIHPKGSPFQFMWSLDVSARKVYVTVRFDNRDATLPALFSAAQAIETVVFNVYQIQA